MWGKKGGERGGGMVKGEGEKKGEADSKSISTRLRETDQKAIESKQSRKAVARARWALAHAQARVPSGT